ncbi:MAG: ornithine carbamoyltransferase [Candidatus Mycalebacterium zealandia]|nr:MAG: ornithine carbamoyltransferase [Candidatus Mycalebacterium zealandia]
MSRHFLSVFDLSKSDIQQIMSRALEHKEMHKTGAVGQSLQGKAVGIVFEKPSTRTRVSFEAAASLLGAHPIFIDSGSSQINRGESLEDTAKVLSSYLDIIVVRTHGHDRLKRFADVSSVPVINALSELEHPTQAVADLLTVATHDIDMDDFKLAYIGDGNNVANSLIGMSSIIGFDIAVACPAGCEPDEMILQKSGNSNGRATHITVTDNPVEAVKDADVIYTDVWVSMGSEGGEDIKKKFAPYQVNSKLLSHAPEDTVVMHCLPAHRGEEITAEVMDDNRCIAFQQAENKLHTAKAVLEFFLDWRDD